MSTFACKWWHVRMCRSCMLQPDLGSTCLGHLWSCKFSADSSRPLEYSSMLLLGVSLYCTKLRNGQQAATMTTPKTSELTVLGLCDTFWYILPFCLVVCLLHWLPCSLFQDEMLILVQKLELALRISSCLTSYANTTMSEYCRKGNCTKIWSPS